MELEVIISSFESSIPAKADSLCNSFKSFVHNFDVFVSESLASGSLDSTSNVLVALQYLKDHDHYLDKIKGDWNFYSIAVSTNEAVYTLYEYGIRPKLSCALDKELVNLFERSTFLKELISGDWAKSMVPTQQELEYPF